MRKILFLSDNSDAAENAARVGLHIAQKMNADLLVGELNKVITLDKQLVRAGEQHTQADQGSLKLEDSVIGKPNLSEFRPKVDHIDLSGFDAQRVAQLVIQQDIKLLIKGIKASDDGEIIQEFNIHSVLNRIACPLLLVPDNWLHINFERIVYMADLRYCKFQVLKFLAALGDPDEADLMVAHVSEKGIPDMDKNYAREFFDEVIRINISYNRLLFDHIKEKDLLRATDILIHGMNTDLLVLVNHHFHFEEIMGRYISHIMPKHITIPLLVFPS
ncbi:MAG TPA: universal stress protein [Mucilaginibacter sp.]